MNNGNYPKSINGIQCVGPCYYPNTRFLHPISLEVEKEKESVCPTPVYIDPITKEEKSNDICSNPTANKDNKDKVEMMTITPNLSYNEGQFLKIYYNIFNLEDAIDHINTNFMPNATKERIFNLSMKLYGKHLTVVEHRIFNIIKEYIQRKVPMFYKKIGKYIKINKDSVDIHTPTTMDVHNEDEDTRNTKSKYIIKMFFSDSDIYKFINKYLKSNRANWENISNHLINMRISMAIYMENIIKKTINDRTKKSRTIKSNKINKTSK